MNNFIVGLDIGSHNIKAAVAEIKKDGKPVLLRIFKMPCEGMRRGMVDDVAGVTHSVNQIFSEIKKISKNAIKNIILSVGSNDVKVHSSKGIVAVSRADYEIHKDDVDRVIEASRAINLPPNRMILYAVTQEFIVDGVGEIKNPIDMVGNRLEVNSLIMDAFAPTVKNLSRCVEIAGGEIKSLIFGPLAANRAVLSKNQKELGVVLVDIGFGKTSMSLYEEGKLLHAAVFPFGSGNVTNDLAIGLKSSIPTAELVKLSFGSALAREVSGREMIDLRKIDPASRGSVSRRFISEVIEVRLAEIMEFVNNELKRFGRSAKLPAGVVIVGGGAKLPGMVELAKKELNLAAQIGIPDVSDFNLGGGELSSQIEDPEFATVIGLLLMSLDKVTEDPSPSLISGGFLKNLWRYFAP